MPPSSGELWGTLLMSHQITLDILLPTGIIIILECNRSDTLKSIKSLVWKEARRLPLFARLLDPSSYIFVSITQDTLTPQEFYDETKRICDLHLFRLFLKLVEPEGNKEEKMLNTEIGMAIGMPVMQDIERDFHNEPQVFDFRKEAIETVKNAIMERDRKGIEGAALYAYPPDICDRANLPVNVYSQDRSRLNSQLSRTHSPMHSTSNLSISRSSTSLKSFVTGKDSHISNSSHKGDHPSSHDPSTGASADNASCSNSTSSNSSASSSSDPHLNTERTEPLKNSDQCDAVSTISSDMCLNLEGLSLCLMRGPGSIGQLSSIDCGSTINSLDRYYMEEHPICVWILQNGGSGFQNHQKFTVRVSISKYPIDVICAVIRKRMRSMPQVPPAKYEQVVEKYKSEYILKVCGQELYFISDEYPLCQYRYIRNCLAHNSIPQLMMVLKKSFEQELRDCLFRVPSFMRRGKVIKHAPSLKRDCMALWSVDPTLKFKVASMDFIFIIRKILEMFMWFWGYFMVLKNLTTFKRLNQFLMAKGGISGSSSQMSQFHPFRFLPGRFLDQWDDFALGECLK